MTCIRIFRGGKGRYHYPRLGDKTNEPILIIKGKLLGEERREGTLVFINETNNRCLLCLLNKTKFLFLVKIISDQPNSTTISEYSLFASETGNMSRRIYLYLAGGLIS